MDHLDPVSKTPEYKYCAVRVDKIDDQTWAEQYVQDTYSDMKKNMRAAAHAV